MSLYNLYTSTHTQSVFCCINGRCYLLYYMYECVQLQVCNYSTHTNGNGFRSPLYVYYACVVVLPANTNLRHVFPKEMKKEHKTLITPQMKPTSTNALIIDIENFNGTSRHSFNAVVSDQDLVEVRMQIHIHIYMHSCIYKNI